jgi:glucose/arabinose dehydrogenase
VSGADCSKTVQPLIEMPAYSTIIGAAFYPAGQGGVHAFPQSYRGGVFLSVRGSWHKTTGKYYSPPRIAYVAMNGDAPKTPVDWSDPSKQWQEFIGGFQLSDGVTRIARSTGIAVGRDGSLFFADDSNGYVYRVRPTP